MLMGDQSNDVLYQFYIIMNQFLGCFFEREGGLILGGKSSVEGMCGWIGPERQ